jgi:uncharacterized PurR-regulated membrane protein YhhQ (DUF165 family)
MWVAIYVATIVAVNWLFTVVPPWSTPLGDLYVASVVVGFVFVFRDYAQRQIGHYILLATLFAGFLTYLMAGPELAFASVTAFLISESSDWAVYSFWRRPLQQRILVSSLVSVPLDTLSFLYLSGYLTPANFVMEVVSKAVGVLIVWQLLRMRAGGTPAPAH